MDKSYIPILRLENLAAALAFLSLYHQLGHDWRTFAWWILAPDLALLAYLFGPRAGACAYNTTHSYVGPVLLVLAAPVLATEEALLPPPVQLALIWLAHIAVDRALGFGLKSTGSFHLTHLGEVKFGRRSRPASQSGEQG